MRLKTRRPARRKATEENAPSAAELVAYVDESGSDDGSAFYVIAGFAATEARWQKFEREWRHALADAGLTYFHMVDAVQRRRAFEKWSTETRDRLLKRLIHIIKSNGLFAFGSAVTMADYREIVKEWPPTLRVESPYIFNFHIMVGRLLDAFPGRRIRVICDENIFVRKQVTQYEAVLKSLSDKYRNGLGDVCFADDKQRLPLQAADLLAWETRRYVIDKQAKKQVRMSIRSLLDLESVSALWDRASLRAYIDGLKEHAKAATGNGS